MCDGQAEDTGIMGERDVHATPLLENTGVSNLDAVLGGGLPRGAQAIIVGPPGSGKTTLACQIAFSAARVGRRALILTALSTALSEPTSKLVSHMRAFSFFDDALLGELVQILSLEQFLQHDPTFFPELTTADVIIGIHYRLRGVRSLRGTKVGSLGTGKSTLGLRFALTGAMQGEPALFLSFRETPAQLQIKARIFDAEDVLDRALAPSGGLKLLHTLPVEIDPDVVADHVLMALDRRSGISPHDAALHEYVIGPPEGIHIATSPLHIEGLSHQTPYPSGGDG